MRVATFTVRIESESEERAPRELSALILQAEALISDGLPEGFYAKVEDLKDDYHLGPAVRPMETYGGGA